MHNFSKILTASLIVYFQILTWRKPLAIESHHKNIRAHFRNVNLFSEYKLKIYKGVFILLPNYKWSNTKCLIWLQTVQFTLILLLLNSLVYEYF